MDHSGTVLCNRILLIGGGQADWVPGTERSRYYGTTITGAFYAFNLCKIKRKKSGFLSGFLDTHEWAFVGELYAIMEHRILKHNNRYWLFGGKTDYSSKRETENLSRVCLKSQLDNQ